MKTVIFATMLIFSLSAVLLGQLVVNEIMYNSLGVDQEWVEFKCLHGSPIYLDSTWILTDGEGTFHFPSVMVIDYLTVIVDTVWSGDTVIHFTPDVDATSHGLKLANTGDDVILLHIVGSDTIVVDSVTYSPSWAPQSNGNGPSLERISPEGGSNDPSNWQASAVDWGTPGAPNGIAEKSIAPRTLSISATPNPFNSECQIRIISQSVATAEIIDISGRVLSKWDILPGENSICWSAENIFSGIYFVRVKSNIWQVSMSILQVR